MQDAPAVHEPLGRVAGRGEGLSHAFVGDQEMTVGGQQPAGGPQRPHRVAHVVERLEDGDELEPGLGSTWAASPTTKVTRSARPAWAAWARASAIDAWSRSTPRTWVRG
jgi:hypothetical protein